jgi:hypothetical protein
MQKEDVLSVAANKPNYSAAYIQDKITSQGYISWLGLRGDRYDANTSIEGFIFFV